MDREANRLIHEASVDGWLARSIDHGSSADIVRLFHAAIDAVGQAAVTTLGSVTLGAIADRVLSNAIQRYGFLSSINLRSRDGRWREQLHEKLAAVPRAQLIEGLRFGLIELLTVIGALTAEILRDPLHAALAAVTPVAEEKPASGAAVTTPTLVVVADKVSR